MKRTLVAAGLLALLLPVLGSSADDPKTVEVLDRYKPVIDRGLQWLAKQQARDGHWEAMNGTYPVPMTALAGLALMAEGSTPAQGKYAKEIDNAVEYLMSRAQKNGLIGRPDDPREQQRYMYGHGFATLFLAMAYGEENDEKRRRELENVLKRAVEFTGRAQTRLGGWGYVSAMDNADFDEGSVTITQVQALRACKNAGIPVPKEIIDKAHDYLKKSTMISVHDPDPKKVEAGVIYSLRQGGGNIRPPLTAAAVACLFNAGEYKNELAIKWINYCQRHIPVDQLGRDSFGHWEYTHFYYAQVLYTLGEDRHRELRPDLPDSQLLKWSRYRDETFKYIASRQNPDGSWSQGYIGPVYTTSLHLLILQLDKGNLPIFQR
ncbi:MAG: terpene cyclase/mutase family protein [Gemmatales bacterium]|nr:terpene cyclase/mutase family protein [Gemmatales bacterium]MDW8388338.1 terpene cyclase/mutase family protein [Gemmatales bacterium]